MEVEKCEYCYEHKVMKNKLYPNLPIIDDFTEEEFFGNDTPLQYIRKENNKYQLTTETQNSEGDVLILNLNYCPMCGRKLV